MHLLYCPNHVPDLYRRARSQQRFGQPVWTFLIVNYIRKLEPTVQPICHDDASPKMTILDVVSLKVEYQDIEFNVQKAQLLIFFRDVWFRDVKFGGAAS
jgi:hypothetical protein